ncbi:Serine/threonine-protein phosphatase 5 [Diplonema papillatum]|nr:Serine/threonine-protein phosphatase 5 [Diplonema papillatum]
MASYPSFLYAAADEAPRQTYLERLGLVDEEAAAAGEPEAEGQEPEGYSWHPSRLYGDDDKGMDSPVYPEGLYGGARAWEPDFSYLVTEATAEHGADGTSQQQPPTGDEDLLVTSLKKQSTADSMLSDTGRSTGSLSPLLANHAGERQEWVAEESAAATIQRMFRMQQAKVSRGDEAMWEAFKMVDENQEWQTVARMEKMRKLQNALCSIVGESVSIERTPTGKPHAMPCLTEKSIRKMMVGLEKGQHIPMMDAISLLEAAIVQFATEPTVNYVDSDGCRIVVVGDLHGSLRDLTHVLREYGLPGPGTKYVFNGDLVDRGSQSCEVLLLIVAVKLSAPEAVFVNRGNHEEAEVNVFYGFIEECRMKYDMRFYDLCSRLFEWLPYVTCLNRKVAVLHGGLSSERNVTLREIDGMARGSEFLQYRSDREEKIIADLKWSDPHKSEKFVGTAPSPRGRGVVFGKDVTRTFLDDNGLSLLIRSHEEQLIGYRLQHDAKLITVFSCSNYVNHNNGAAVVVFEAGDNRPYVHKWHAQTTGPAGSKRSNPSMGENFKALCRYIEESIVENSDALLAYWKVHDAGDTGTVSMGDWVKGMMAELRLDSLQQPIRKHLLPKDLVGKGETVNYRKFVAHHHDKLLRRIRTSGVVSAWHWDAAAELSKYLKDTALDVEKAFDLFDTTRNGILSYEEFRVALRKVVSLDVLSNQQIESLARAFDVDNDGNISRKEFTDCLHSVDTRTSRALVDNCGAVNLEWTADRRTESLRLLQEQLRPYGKDKCREVLLEYDANGDRKIDAAEIEGALRKGFDLKFYKQVFTDLLQIVGGGEETTESTLRQATHRSFPVKSVSVPTFGSEESQCYVWGMSKVVQYQIRVEPVVGKPWTVDHRYSAFATLDVELTRLAARHTARSLSAKNRPPPAAAVDGQSVNGSFSSAASGAAALPGRFPVFSKQGLERRRAGLETWLAAAVARAGRVKTLRQPLRAFLRVPGDGELRSSTSPSIAIDRLLRALFPDPDDPQRELTPVLAGVMLKLLYQYRTELKHIFYSRDGVSSGVISAEDFQATLVSLNELEGHPLTRAQVDALVRRMDINNDGMIDYTEFEQAVNVNLETE